VPEHADPAEVAVARDTIRLAFVTALQHLPARQRATLILCEVLRMPAAEAATTLGTSVPAVNSALQRARATLAALPPEQRPGPLDADQAGLLNKYVDAFQRYDMDQLVTLLQDDALMTMPPWAMWIRGAENVIRWMQEPTPSLCRDSVMRPAGQVNGVPAWAQYKPDPAGGHAPWALQVHEVSGGRISRLTFFIETGKIFPSFGLPTHLP
jgi:RNA polymerase sigma-70 factor, ECF subfamily